MLTLDPTADAGLSLVVVCIATPLACLLCLIALLICSLFGPRRRA